MRPERWLALAASGLYIVSLFLPAIAGSGFPTQSGWDVLREGAGAWRDGIFSWYANPSIWIAFVLLFFGRFRLALAAVAIGTILALSSYAAAPIAEAGGRSLPPFHFAPGFYVWLAAFVVAGLAAVLGMRGFGRNIRPEP